MSVEQLKKQENIGVSLIAVGIGGFFLSMWYFGIFDSRPEFSTEWPKLLIPLLSILTGVTGGGYAVAGKKGVITALSLFIFLFFIAVVSGLIIGATNELDSVYQ